MDLGLERTGIDIVIGQDFDQNCVDTMRVNGRRALAGDIRGISPEAVLDMAGMKAGEPFLVCGGPPCQPFSTAGKRLGINDPRGSLFADFVRMLDFIRPRFFIMENVKGIMSAPLRDADGNASVSPEGAAAVLDVILSEFGRLGYRTVYGILDAVNYGVPQFRERFILIGSRDNEDIFLPFPTHFQMHQDAAYRWRTAGSAIKDLEDSHGECGKFSDGRIRYLRMIPEGGNWRDLPADVMQDALGGAYFSAGGKTGLYRRLSYSQPAPTLVTSPAQMTTMLCHPVKDRPLSIREYARLQQFPDDWHFSGSVSARYRQIGNAVPLGLAEAVGKAVVSAAEGTAQVRTKRRRGTGIHNKIMDALTLGGSACAAAETG